MRSRGLRADVRRETYGKILDADPPGAKRALAGSRDRGALTMHQRDERERRKACRIFVGDAEICARALCGHPRETHPKTWRQTAA